MNSGRVPANGLLEKARRWKAETRHSKSHDMLWQNRTFELARDLIATLDLLQDLRDYTAEVERRYMPFVATRGYATLPEAPGLRERLDKLTMVSEGGGGPVGD